MALSQYQKIPQRRTLPTHATIGGESYYGSPPNFSLTKSPVSKAAPGCISPENTVSLDTPTSSIDRPLCKQENIWVIFFSISSVLPCVEQPCMEGLLKKIASFGGGAIIVESVVGGAFLWAFFCQWPPESLARVTKPLFLLPS